MKLSGCTAKSEKKLKRNWVGVFNNPNAARRLHLRLAPAIFMAVTSSEFMTREARVLIDFLIIVTATAMLNGVKTMRPSR